MGILRSILHVEDDDATAFLVQLALQETAAMVAYCRVSDVSSALECLLMIDKQKTDLRPQLILLDVNLPPRSGFEVLKMVRTTESLKHIRVVIFSSTEASKESLALGAFACIVKPSTFDEYLLALRMIVEMIPEQQVS
jgi:two-component system, chemotaxis family, response regulator Rcp1